MKILILLLLLASTANAQTLTVNYTYTRGTVAEDGFILQRKSGPLASTSAWTELIKLPSSARSYADTAVLHGAEYCYRVSAYIASGASAWSNIGCAKTGAPPVPDGVPVITLPIQVSQVAGGPATASWTAPPDATPLDWVGLYLSKSADTAHMPGCWTYTQGKSSYTPPDTCKVKGTYNYRYLRNDGFTSIGKSLNFVVP